MKAIVRTTASTYETGDVISIVEDNHVFGSRDLLAGARTSVDVGTLTSAEIAYFTMQDKQFRNMTSALQVPTFRHYLFKDKNRTLVKRRKYKRDAQNKPVLK
jgi:hypothetical protein